MDFATDKRKRKREEEEEERTQWELKRIRAARTKKHKVDNFEQKLRREEGERRNAKKT